MELLRRRGSAPVYQKIEFSGTKRQRIFGPNEAEAIRTDLRDNEILQNMERCLRKKQQRAGGNQFYRGAWLGIVFDEWPPGHDQDRWDALSTRLVEAKSFEPFKRLFCVGMHRSYVFDSKRLASSQSGLS
jgi:hypothetical protein